MRTPSRFAAFPARPASPFLLAGGAALAGLLGLGLVAPTAPGITKTTVLENDRVRAQVNDYPPGARGPEHEHAVPRVVVVLEGGTLEVRGEAGDVKTLHLKAGDVVWRPAEKHAIANPGATPVRVVEIDILDCRQAPVPGTPAGS